MDNPYVFPELRTRVLEKFCDKLVDVATRHLNVYVRGTPVSTVTHGNIPANSPSSSARYGKSSLQSYTDAAKRKSHPSTATGNTTSRNPAQNQPSKHKTDDKLFLRLPTDGPFCSHSGYALHSILKSKVGPEGHLISNCWYMSR